MTNVKKLYSFQKLPKWFNGEVYTKGATVKNPHYYAGFSKETHKLTANELSMYVFIISSKYLSELNLLSVQSYKNMMEGRDWFALNNPNAFYDLLEY